MTKTIKLLIFAAVVILLGIIVIADNFHILHRPPTGGPAADAAEIPVKNHTVFNRNNYMVGSSKKIRLHRQQWLQSEQTRSFVRKNTTVGSITTRSAVTL